jgi:hypothetical protein
LRVLENEAKIDIWAILDGKVDVMISPQYKKMFQHEFLNMYNVDCEIFINNVGVCIVCNLQFTQKRKKLKKNL